MEGCPQPTGPNGPQSVTRPRPGQQCVRSDSRTTAADGAVEAISPFQAQAHASVPCFPCSTALRTSQVLVGAFCPSLARPRVYSSSAAARFPAISPGARAPQMHFLEPGSCTHPARPSRHLPHVHPFHRPSQLPRNCIGGAAPGFFRRQPHVTVCVLRLCPGFSSHGTFSQLAA